MARELSDLFSIDVDAEVRKLSGRQFASDVDRLGELIRVAIRSGARAVRVKARRKTIELVASGARLPADQLRFLAQVRDSQIDASERHRALVSCERSGLSGCLSLLAEPGFMVRSGDACLVADRDGLQVTRGLPPTEHLVVRIERGCSKADFAALANNCRFAPVPVVIKGRRVDRGIDEQNLLLLARFRHNGCVGTVALPTGQPLCHTVYLLDGVIWRESYGVSRRGYSHFAVVEDKNAVHGDSMRGKQLSQLVRELRRKLYDQLHDRFFELPMKHRLSARDLLLRRCEQGRHPAALQGLPIFRRLAGASVALEQLNGLVKNNLLWAVESVPRRTRYVAEPGQVLVLDQTERNFVQAYLSVGLAEPPRRAQDLLWRRAARALRRGCSQTWTRTLQLTSGFFAPRPLPAEQLTGRQRDLIHAIEAELRRGRLRLPGLPETVSRRTAVVMVDRGVLPARRRRIGDRQVLCLPRRHPRVRRMVDALASDREALYPICAALLAGHDAYGVHKRPIHSALLRRAAEG